MTKKGSFITFEGVEGCGKTTQAQLAYDTLIDKGHDVIISREPGGTEAGERIREILLDKDLTLSRETELLLYISSRTQHSTELIIPAIEKGTIVICDRFTDASRAYQGAGRGIPLIDIEYIHNAFGILVPNLTVLIDVPIREGIKRKELEKELDRLESEKTDFHERVRQGYLDLAKQYPDRIVVFNGEECKSYLHQQIMKTINERLDL